MTTTLPLVSLPINRDVTTETISREIDRAWDENNRHPERRLPRAKTFSLIVYEPNNVQSLLSALGFYTGPLDGIIGPMTTAALKKAQKNYQLPRTGLPDTDTVSRLEEAIIANSGFTVPVENPNKHGLILEDEVTALNPARIITLLPVNDASKGLQAQVAVYCPLPEQSDRVSGCCDYITLTDSAESLSRQSSMIASFQLPDLPHFLWWKGSPLANRELLDKLDEVADVVIFDSANFEGIVTETIVLDELRRQNRAIADLNWFRLAPWQELTAEVFDPPQRRESIAAIDRLELSYESGSSAQAWLFLAWFASRLNWQPTRRQHIGGEYDLQSITFTTPDNRDAIAELAAIPLGSPTPIPGDLTGLKLTSSDPNAACTTVLCSETLGCTYMERGSGGQNTVTEQVSYIGDRRAETLLAQYLRRWGRDPLYESALELTTRMLQI
jgi:glucose-6-phosphate dehydrogenase assembly protein OpcA